MKVAKLVVVILSVGAPAALAQTLPASAPIPAEARPQPFPYPCLKGHHCFPGDPSGPITDPAPIKIAPWRKPYIVDAVRPVSAYKPLQDAVIGVTDTASSVRMLNEMFDQSKIRGTDAGGAVVLVGGGSLRSSGLGGAAALTKPSAALFVRERPDDVVPAVFIQDSHAAREARVVKVGASETIINWGIRAAAGVAANAAAQAMDRAGEIVEQAGNAAAQRGAEAQRQAEANRGVAPTIYPQYAHH